MDAMERLLKRYRTTIIIVRKPFLYCGLVTFWALAALAQQPAADIERVRALVDAGAAPRSAIDKAMAEIEDRTDDMILRETLYGSLKVEEITPTQTQQMIQAAERRVARKRQRIDALQPLVDQGIYAKAQLEPLLLELKEREETLALARSRAKFLDDLSEMIRREEEFAQLEEPVGPRPVRERFDGNGAFGREQMKRMVLAFEKEFSRALPVSANGDTAFHRAMGFDHRGRLDVALNPDDPEGQWLRKFLEREGIPYYAFRAAVAGAASGAHIHIGPPSLRLKSAD